MHAPRWVSPIAAMCWKMAASRWAARPPNCYPARRCRTPISAARATAPRWKNASAPSDAPSSAAKLSRLVADDRLDLKELVEAPFAVFAAIARQLVAAERRRGVHRGIVQMHAAGAHPRCHLTGMAEIGRLHIGREAVHRLVRHPDRVGLVAIGQDRQHRAEDFLLRDTHVVAHAGEDGRAHEIAAIEMLRPAWAARHQLRALVDAGLDQALDLSL